jgi:hypothetical protein
MKAALLPVLASFAFAAGLLENAPVQVEIYEAVAPVSELAPAGEPTYRYTEPAFGFARLPVKYSAEALPLDRSIPFVLRATYERAVPQGPYRFRLRARGASRLLIDGIEGAKTEKQKPNTSGDDPVPAPPVRDESGHRPPTHPHQDAFVNFSGDGKVHKFELVAIIGGKGLMPTPGELAVSFGPAGKIEMLLGPDGSPLLTDAEWESHIARQEARHRLGDRERRLEASREIMAKWRARHVEVREYYKDRVVAIPPATAGLPALQLD